MIDKSAIIRVQRISVESIAVIGMNYRLIDEAQWSAQLDELKSVIQFVKTNAKQYRLDNTRIASQ